MDMTIRRASSHDASELAPLANQAGEGLPLYAWGLMAAPGQDPWEVGRARIEGTEAGISHRNAWVAEFHGHTAGLLVAYRQPAEFEPLPADIPAVFRPLAELETHAPETGYVYVLATSPEFQGRGIGSRLLEHAEEHYRSPKGMSIIVADHNEGARRLYARHGYSQKDSVPMVKGDWQCEGSEWLLLVKP